MHGGGTWVFPNCVWAPTEKRGGGSWPFWSKILQVREGDTIIHLRGVSPDANFVGYSVAVGDGFITRYRPPVTGTWDHAKHFYRANLSDYTPFHEPINLTDVFSTRKAELEGYFDRNRSKGASKANIFYVRQAGRLQCLNGAYLSEIDNELLAALFKSEGVIAENGLRKSSLVQTGSHIATIQSRVGQRKFSEEVKKAYGYKCCFPGCTVADPRFLIGSHIARWSDNEKLRGHLGNGLCLCLFHDKAFEIGLFTLDNECRVYLNPKNVESGSEIVRELVLHGGQQITRGEIAPLEEALLEHSMRVGVER